MPQSLNINYQQLTDLISEAKMEEVFGVLQKALRGQPGYGEYFKEVVLLSNNYSQLERAKRIDIVGFQDYTTKSNQITSALLEIIEDLKAGKVYQVHRPSNISIMGSWKIMAIFSFILLSILGGGTVAYLYLVNKDKDKEANAEEEIAWTCPVYNTPAFKVLVLPFNKEISNDRTPPHIHIISRLDEFSRSKNLQVHIGTIQSEADIEPAYSQQEANKYASRCEPDMLVWGRADILEEKTGLVMHYSLTNPAQFEWISDFETDGKIDTILTDALTPKTYEGATREIEEVLEKIIESTIAYKNGEYAIVINITETLPKGIASSTQEEEATMFLQYLGAASYQKTNQPEKAIATYSEILEKDPIAPLALNNRAHLQFKQKKYNKALVDFNALETLDKANYEVLYKKAEAHEHLGNLGAAKEDFEKAESICPPRVKKTITAHRQQVEKKIKVEEDKISRANRAKPKRGPKNKVVPNTPTTATRPISKAAQTEQLITEAAQQNTIGNAVLAEEKAIEILKTQPNNKKALKELIRAKYFQDHSISIRDLKKNPYLSGLDPATLQKWNDPVLEVVLRNEMIRRKSRTKGKKGN